MILVQIVEVNVSSEAAGGEAEIILKPFDALDFLYVTGEHHTCVAVLGVEGIYVNVFCVGDTSEHMSTMGELDFVTTLQVYGFNLTKLLGENIMNLDLILHSHNEVKT